MGLAETSASARAASRFTSAVTRGLRESAIIALGIVALVLLIALLTYSPDDPGFSFTGNSAPVHNRIGVIGAWLADVLFFLFGRPAFLFPLVLAAACWGLQRRLKAQAAVSRVNTLVRFAGFVLVLVASCGLTTLHWQPGALRQTAGGVAGSVVGEGLVAGLDFLGATLVLIAAWMAGLSLAFGVSWLTIMDRLGALTWGAIGRWRARWATARDAAEGRERRQARKEAMESEQRKSATRAPPRIEPPLPVVEKSARVERERQVPLFDPPKASELPPLKLLDDPPPRESLYSAEALEALSRLVEMKLKDFTIDAEVVAVQPGPVVTRFELRPAPGVKASQITALAKDLARALSVLSVRVVEVIPGKSVMGLEIANEKREVVTLGEIIRSRAYDEMHSPLALALGKDIGGQPVVADLTRMPHLLIAGTTGSGKSVALNAMVLSLLYKSTAEHVRLIMIDPKMLELSVYEGIPHLLAPVVTDMKQAANDPSIDQRQILDLTPLPYVVVVVDEFADMMMIVGKKVEELITRLAQKARASGIHLVLATQRPSVDVITGLIKANIPCRIAFQVSARVDSRTILDQMGAETLLGHGDMLYLPPGTSLPTRVHGAFVSDQEVHRVVEALKTPQPPHYIEEVLSGPRFPIPGLSGEDGEGDGGNGGEDAEQDPLYDEAVRIVTTERKPSISYVQRRLKIGYNRAARMLEGMEQAGLVGPLQANGARDVLAPAPPEE
ncbi:MAG: cell division protein FtsK [Gammaproteobacteria bacterium]|nr:MAG: cell division protein FtsK [Gammaproteobacteria bacterium]